VERRKAARQTSSKRATEVQDSAPQTARIQKESAILVEDLGFHSDRQSNRPITGGKLQSNTRFLKPIKQKTLTNSPSSSSSSAQEDIKPKRTSTKRKIIA